MTTFIGITRVVHHEPRLVNDNKEFLTYHREWINIDSIGRVLENRVFHIGDNETITGQLFLDHLPANMNHYLQTKELHTELVQLIAAAATLVELDEDGHAWVSSRPTVA